jgi:hypothetical protein
MLPRDFRDAKIPPADPAAVDVLAAAAAAAAAGTPTASERADAAAGAVERAAMAVVLPPACAPLLALDFRARSPAAREGPDAAGRRSAVAGVRWMMCPVRPSSSIVRACIVFRRAAALSKEAGRRKMVAGIWLV